MLKSLLWLIGIVIILLIAIIVSLQFPAVQNFVVDKATSYVSGKIKSKVEIGEINLSFPKSVVLKDVYVETPAKDTLWYSQYLKVNLDMWGLLSKKIEINDLELNKATAHISRRMPDSTFNFQFIMDGFSSGDTAGVTEKDTTKVGWKIGIFDVELNDIYATFNDEVTGMHSLARLGHIETDIDEFDLDTKKFDIDNIKIENVFVDVLITKKAVESNKESEPLTYDIKLNEVALNKIRLKYENKADFQLANLDLDKAKLVGKRIDLAKQKVELKSFELENSSASYVINKYITPDTLLKHTQKTVTQEKEKTKKGKDWEITLEELKLANNKAKFDNFNEPELKRGMDYAHLQLDSIQVDVEDIFFRGNNIKANIAQLALREKKSGFQLNEFKTKLKMEPAGTELAELNIQTNRSKITKYISVGYNSLENIAEHIGDLKIMADVEKTTISFADILIFKPDLAKTLPFRGNQHKLVNIDAKIDGEVKDLNIRDLAISTKQNTYAHIQGKVKGLPDIDKAYFDLNIPKISTSGYDIRTLAPGTVPDSIQLPQFISMNGFFRGRIKDFDARTEIATSFGNASALVSMNMLGGEGNEKYTAKISTREFNVGKLIRQEKTLGVITMKADIDGRGFEPSKMNTTIKAHVDKAAAMGYAYNNLNIDGRVYEEKFTGKADMKDKNLEFTFDGTVGFDTINPKYEFVFNLEGADLQALKLTKDDLRVKGYLKSNISGRDLNSLNGDVSVSDVLFVKEGKSYPINSFLFASISEKRNNDIKIESDFLSAKFKGTINVGDLPKVLKQHINNYFTLHDQQIDKNLQPQNFSFEINLHRTELLTDVFVPKLTRIVPGTIKGSYDSRAMALKADIKLPHLTYSKMELDSLGIDVSSDKQKLNYAVRLQRFKSGDILIERTRLSGKIENDSITANLQQLDSARKQKVLIAGILNSEKDLYTFRFLPDGLMFNYEQWNAAPDNLVRYGKKGIYVRNLRLNAANKFIYVNTRGDELGDPLVVDFKNFSLADVTEIVKTTGNNVYVGGIVNGSVTLNDVTKKLAFIANLKINDFSFKGDTLGNIKLLADNKTAGRYNANVEISGKGNNITAVGYYAAAEKNNALNFDVNINSLNLASVESYTAGQLKDMSGNAKGRFKITGTTTAPNINGNLNFSNAALRISMLGALYSLPDENISFNESGIFFSNFSLVDSLNNRAEVNGHIYTQHYKSFRYDLNIVTNNFRALNSTEKDNELYYGKMFISSRIKVRGDFNQPVVDATVSIKEGTNITLVLPTDDPAIQEREGVVEYIDQDSVRRSQIMLKQKGNTKDTITTRIKGIIVHSNIEVDKKAQLRIIVDKEAGDYLQVRGAGTLSFGIDQSGLMSLTGRYEIAEGSYQLSFYQFVKRRFEIQPGSSITWLGSPTKANLDITAIYNTKTAALPLVEQQIAGLSDQEKNKYRQKLPFQVKLAMTGDLMLPTIDLAIDLPEDQRGAMGGAVYNRVLQMQEDKSEMNKQVFSLLVLGRFLPEDPLKPSDGGGGGGVAAAVSSSVSELLSQQLNTLAGKYLKDVQVNFNLENYQDYSTGDAQNKTKLQVDVSKQFLNDRLTVKVGSDVELEGESGQQTKAEGTKANASEIVSDVSVEYMLTKDGRLRIMVFRNNEYAGLIEGQVIETGMGLIFVRDFNNFKNLFKKPKEEEENL